MALTKDWWGISPPSTGEQAEKNGWISAPIPGRRTGNIVWRLLEAEFRRLWPMTEKYMSVRSGTWSGNMKNLCFWWWDFTPRIFPLLRNRIRISCTKSSLQGRCALRQRLSGSMRITSWSAARRGPCAVRLPTAEPWKRQTGILGVCMTPFRAEKAGNSSFTCQITGSSWEREVFSESRPCMRTPSVSPSWRPEPVCLWEEGVNASAFWTFQKQFWLRPEFLQTGTTAVRSIYQGFPMRVSRNSTGLR